LGKGELWFILENAMRSCFEFIKKETNHELVGAEIGVHMGNNVEDMLKNLNIKKLYLVDCWQGRQAVLFKPVQNRFNGNKKVCMLRTTSIKAGKLITEPLDFVYIDADHSYKSVMQDLKVWTVKVKQGGFVCGHDYVKRWPGVRQAVFKFCNKRGICYSVQSDDKNARYKSKQIYSCDWWFKKG